MLPQPARRRPVLPREEPVMPSTAVRDIEYDPVSETLWVTFVPTAKRYAYRAVPLSVYEDFLHAFSKGTFFNRFIRDRYDYSEVEEDG
jgi:hypothetical protein